MWWGRYDGGGAPAPAPPPDPVPEPEPTPAPEKPGQRKGWWRRFVDAVRAFLGL